MQYRQGVSIVGKRMVEIDDAIGAGTTDWEALSNPYEYYRTLDLGPGGYAHDWQQV